MLRANVSLIIPVHNEEEILLANLNKLINYLQKSKLINRYEIILVENGSTDGTLKTLKRIEPSYEKIKILTLNNRSLGDAINYGLKRSKYNLLMFYAIDLPFGLNVIDNSLEKITKGSDLVFGSKSHNESQFSAQLHRVLISKFLNIAINLLFNLKIKDARGSFLIRRSLYAKITKHLTSSSAWIQIQLALYSTLRTNNIEEIPISSQKPQRPSKMNFKDFVKIMRDMTKEYRKFKQINTSH